MKKFKTVLMMLLVVSISLSLVSCGDNDDAFEGKYVGEGTLIINGDEQDFMRGQVEVDVVKFDLNNEEYPTYQISFEMPGSIIIEGDFTKSEYGNGLLSESLQYLSVLPDNKTTTEEGVDALPKVKKCIVELEGSITFNDEMTNGRAKFEGENIYCGIKVSWTIRKLKKMNQRDSRDNY